MPDTSPAAASIHRVRTRWMDVSGPSPRVGISSPIYPVFNTLRGMGSGGRYSFPDQATGAQRNLIGPNQTWTPGHPVTLISTVGHLHPGGLQTGLRVRRGVQHRTLFSSKAHYYEPANVEREIDRQLEKVKSALISERELQKAKNQVEAAFVFAQDSIFGQAMKIGSYEAAGGWRQMDNYLDGIRKVTREDIRRVAKQYLDRDRRTAGTLIPTKSP